MSINSGLLALSNICNPSRAKSHTNSHVSYWDSKLTGLVGRQRSEREGRCLGRHGVASTRPGMANGNALWTPSPRADNNQNGAGVRWWHWPQPHKMMAAPATNAHSDNKNMVCPTKVYFSLAMSTHDAQTGNTENARPPAGPNKQAITSEGQRSVSPTLCGGDNDWRWGTVPHHQL
jgi:hypothetical protein